MHSGNYVLILHTHLPWVLNHGTWPHGVDWLTEAVAECYIPLLNVFNDLLDKGIKPNVSLDISPVLCEQASHPDFKKVFIDYCDSMIAAAKQDEKDFKNWDYDPHHIYLTQFWQNWYEERKNDFINKYDHNVIAALKELQDKDAIEMMTCGATHGYMPLLGTEKSINLQIKAAIANYEKHFGRKPRGIWLPECAYRPAYEWQSYIPVAPYNEKRLRPGVEQFLAQNGLEYFVTDEKMIQESSAIGKYTEEGKKGFKHVLADDFPATAWNFHKSPLELYEVSSSEKVEYGTATAFTRHHDICMQVWSGEVGYPGQPDYLDFHKKHMASKLRYWRVTDTKADMMYKTLYHPDWVWDKLDHQANHFIHNMENTVNYHKNTTGREASLCTPFDTELFGHWWFEGPEFIRKVCEGLHESPYIKMVKASEEYDFKKPNEIISIPEGSWGVKNTHEVWINEGNKWTWETIYNDENRLKEIFEKYPIEKLNEIQKRILTQAVREMMLLHSSDWQFLIYTESAKDYAEQRFSYHHSDFIRLCELVEKYEGISKLTQHDKIYLEESETRNSIFPELELEWWTDLF